MSDRYAVVGHPISHSRSPMIHALFAGQTAQEMSYTAMDIEPGAFASAVHEFFAGGGKGLNVTVPFKEEAWQIAQQHSESALLAGAVNTLMCTADGQLRGENTDGIGLVRDLRENHRAQLSNSRILIAGAGGAVRGVLPALLAEGPKEVLIANRTLARAEQLATLFADHGQIRGVGFDALASLTPYDIVINGTSAGLKGDLPPLPGSVVGPTTWCYDMIYGTGETAFQAWAQRCGALRALDGSGMLVEQAAEAFCLWRGVRPDTAPVLAHLRETLSRNGKP
jgi:shikimate dehydrogenase